jgi:CheY-like chemotaxis protein
MSYALLIDDDRELVESIERLVEARGLRLDTAHTWDEGLALFQALSPDVVIADYNLPGSRHGLRLLSEIARLRPSVRLVLISAYLRQADVEKVQELGLVDRVLRKIDPMTTARAVLEEVASAAATTDAPTDWAAFARAAKGRRVPDRDFDALDEILKARLPSDGSPDRGETSR